MNKEKLISELKNLNTTSDSFTDDKKEIINKLRELHKCGVFFSNEEIQEINAIKAKKSLKGLANIIRADLKLKQQKLARKKSMPTKGMSVTATLRKDLDLSKDKIFHKNDCKHLENVPYGRGIIFKNRDDAIREGYRPCHVCRP